MKLKKGGILGAMMASMAALLIAPVASSLIQPVSSSWINALTEKRQEGGFHSLLALPLMVRVLGK